MVMPKSYDAEVERKRREIRGEMFIHEKPAQGEVKFTQIAPGLEQPKRRGRPKGSRNKPKVLKSP